MAGHPASDGDLRRVPATPSGGTSRRGHTGRALPRAVMGIVGDSVEVLEAATWSIVAVDRVLASRPACQARPGRPIPMSQALEDTLLLLCATPLATVEELSRFGRIPASTLRDRLKKLAKMGMADSVPHSLTTLGPHPHLRHFPTEKSIHAGAMVEWGPKTFLREYPVSKQWFRLLAERLDAVAALYRAAALVADADSQGKPVRVDHYRQGPYDMLITLSGGRSVGLLRQGPTLPSANLRYRLRTLENLPHVQRPMATLVLAHSDQANRRAVRTLGDPTHHRRTFVATEGELLAGDHRGRGLAAVREGHGARSSGEGSPRRVPERHHSLDRSAGGGVHAECPASSTTLAQRESAEAGPGDHLP